jgi:prepilin-type N-terminal cleavage/methylation domain-containing protein
MTAGERDRGQAGVTLVEMAVVVALLGLVLTMAFQGLVSYQRATASADTRQQNLDQARTVMAVLTKDLRTATEFTTLTATDVTFTGLLNTAATAPANQLRLYVDSGGVLREAVTVPDNPTASPLTYTGTRKKKAVGKGVGVRARSPTPAPSLPVSSARGWSRPRACSASATAPTPSPPA